MSERPIFLFGVNSIIGWSVARKLLAQKQSRVLAKDTRVELFCNQHSRIPDGHRWRRLNLQQRSAVIELFARERPSLIIHGAGICNVEKCETSPEFAHEVNVFGTEVLLSCAPADAQLVYLSSDHVFSGDSGPYYESTPVTPISTYGRTRVLAEKLVRERRKDALIVRGGLWIGPSYNGRLGHLDWLRSRTRRGLPTTVVRDEYRSTVVADQAAERVLAMTRARVSGIRHVVARRIVDRPRLAHYLDHRYQIGATIAIMSRADRPVPHLGRVDLRSEFSDSWAQPLAPVVPDEWRQMNGAR